MHVLGLQRNKKQMQRATIVRKFLGYGSGLVGSRVIEESISVPSGSGVSPQQKPYIPFIPLSSKPSSINQTAPKPDLEFCNAN